MKKEFIKVGLGIAIGIIAYRLIQDKYSDKSTFSSACGCEG